MKNIFIYFSILFPPRGLYTKAKKQPITEEPDYTQYVDPFIGTAYTGHTFPGATYPLGMIQAGPETGNYHGNIVQDTSMATRSSTDFRKPD